MIGRYRAAPMSLKAFGRFAFNCDETMPVVKLYISDLSATDRPKSCSMVSMLMLTCALCVVAVASHVNDVKSASNCCPAVEEDVADAVLTKFAHTTVGSRLTFVVVTSSSTMKTFTCGQCKPAAFLSKVKTLFLAVAIIRAKSLFVSDVGAVMPVSSAKRTNAKLWPMQKSMMSS